MLKINWAILPMLFLILTCCNKKEAEGLERFESEEVELSYDNFSAIIDTLDLGYLKLKCDYKICTEDEIKDFYQQLGQNPAWFDKDGFSENYKELMAAINDSHSHGLNPEHYKAHFPDFLENDSSKEHLEGAPSLIVKTDIALTWAYLTLAQHLRTGKTKPQATQSYWLSKPNVESISQQCAEAIANSDVKGMLEKMSPDRDGYDALREQLTRYTQLAEQGGWGTIPETDSTLEEGMSSPVIPHVRRRLAVTGDMAEGMSSDSLRFDAGLKTALVKFQDRHGLHEDARLGPNTVATLNIPIEDRIKQIEINLERMRWLGKESEGPYLTVNIPEYMLRYYDGGDQKFNMKVIVGKKINRTPIFADTMEYIVFSPTWTVPMSISRNELLPKLKKDPYSLEKQNFVIYESFDKDAPEVTLGRVNWSRMDSSDFAYRVVQQPGHRNALGSIKFIFPNDEDIYLHDTPEGYLFERSDRSFSHGCIRIEKPTYLAKFLLDDKVSEEEIKNMMSLPEPKTVMLPKKLPVFIIYQTALVIDGEMNFRKDIYGYDNLQHRELEQQTASL